MTQAANLAALGSYPSSAGRLTTGVMPAGSVLQVVQGYTNGTTSTTSTSYVSTGLTASITPTSSSSKILVMIRLMVTNTSSTNRPAITVYRNASTNISPYGEFINQEWGYSSGYAWTSAAGEWLDSPSTTSSTTYTLYVKASSAGTAYAMYGAVLNTITLMEIAQ